MEILQYTWTGDCTVDNISEIQKLIVTEPGCNVLNFNKDPWSSAILVNPRHGVRSLWNTPAIKRHWAGSANILYTFNVENSVGKDRRCLSHAWESDNCQHVREENRGAAKPHSNLYRHESYGDLKYLHRCRLSKWSRGWSCRDSTGSMGGPQHGRGDECAPKIPTGYDIDKAS